MSCSLAGNVHCSLHCGDLAPQFRPTRNTDFASVRPRDFDVRPMIVIWEMTQACDLKCSHCRANAQPKRHALELSTAEAFHLIDQIAEMRVPLFVLRSEEHTSELQSPYDLVCRLLLEKKKKNVHQDQH